MADTTPIVTSNGTTRAVLVQERMDAIHALRAAQTAVEAITVNGRDYIGEPDRFRAAIDAHQARLAALRAAISDLTDEVIDLRGSHRE